MGWRSGKLFCSVLPTVVVHRLDELDGGGELHPPVLVLTAQPGPVERLHVLEF